MMAERTPLPSLAGLAKPVIHPSGQEAPALRLRIRPSGLEAPAGQNRKRYAMPEALEDEAERRWQAQQPTGRQRESVWPVREAAGGADGRFSEEAAPMEGSRGCGYAIPGPPDHHDDSCFSVTLPRAGPDILPVECGDALLAQARAPATFLCHSSAMKSGNSSRAIFSARARGPGSLCLSE